MRLGVFRRSTEFSHCRVTIVLVIPLLVAALTIWSVGPVKAQSESEPGGRGEDYVPREEVRVTVELNLEAEATLSPNYIPIQARLTDLVTGLPVVWEYVVLAGVADGGGRRGTEVFSFAYPYFSRPGIEEVGVYKGTVIVPSSGRWTVFVNVFDPLDERISNVPTALGRGELVINVTEAQTLRSATEFGRVTELPSGSPGEVVLLIFHSAFGIVWFVLAAALVCVSMSQRQRWFSEHLNDFLDRHVNRLARVLISVTFLIWLTGILNLNVLVAYPPPLSPEQARALFRLPYAQPYTVALYLKIAMYSVMTLLLVPLLRAARRSAEGWSVGRWDSDGSPGASVARVSGQSRRQGRLSPMARFSVASIAVGSVVILVCVTILKYTHILSESIRSVTP